MTTATDTIQRIQNADPARGVRSLDGLAVGAVAHQGDVYLHRVPDDWPRGPELGTRQVAVGSTVGARHVAEGPDVRVCAGVRLPACFAPDADVRIYLGPVIAAGAGGVTLTHPEHAHHAATGPGTWQVTYQGDLATRERVAD